MQYFAILGRVGVALSARRRSYAALLGAVFLLVTPAAVEAQWCPLPFQPCNTNDPKSLCYCPPIDPDPRCEPEDCEKCKKSPCYAGTGMYGTNATDLSVRTPGLPLEAARSYHSTHAIDGPSGYGWTSSVSVRLFYATYLFAAPSTYQREATITMPTGATYVLVQAGDGSFTPPPGRKDVLVRNGDGSFTLTFQRSRSTLQFASDGTLQSAADDYGNLLSYTYVAGKVQAISDTSGSGRYFNIFWGPDGRISSIQDNSGRQIQYTYDVSGALKTVTDAAGRITTYAYNTGRFSPLLARITDHWGRVVTDVTYDTSDRVHTYTEAGETYTYTYAYGGQSAITAKTDSQGNLFQYPFGSGGLVTDTTPPSGGPAPTHTSYNADGSILSFTDGAGITTTYTYTANGSFLRVTRDATGTPLLYDYVYDPNFPHRPISVTPKDLNGTVNPDWQAWQYDYWQAGSPAPGALNHVYRIRTDGTTRDTLATSIYNSKGQITRVTSAIGGPTDYAYDAQGNLETVTAPANNDAGTRPVTTYGYDSLGRLTSVTDSLTHQTTYAYDSLDRITSTTLPKPSLGSALTFTTTYSYDNLDVPTGLVFTNTTDPNSLVTKQGYDVYGQLAKVTDALNTSTLYGYTGGLLTSITDANGNVTTHSYDAGRRLTRTTFANSAYESYTYTGDSLLSTKTDRKNLQTIYTYDAFKRLSAKGDPNITLALISYAYTGQKLTSVIDRQLTPNETHTFAYDASYRVQQNAQWNRGTLAYTYNPDDTVATMALTSGPTTTYAYYPDGSLNTILWTPVAGQFKYAYTLNGQYQTVSFPNGQTRNFAYDDQGRLLTLSTLLPGVGNLATHAYGYDLNYTTGSYTRLGQRVSMSATVPAQGLNNHVTKYEYDPVYQLTKATYPNVAPFNGELDSWTYDAIGNRLTNTVNGVTAGYTYQRIGANPNNWQRLTSDGVNAYTYDGNGNTATRTGYTFSWDRENRMSGITGGVGATYFYDYQGRRWGKSLATGTAYVYDGLKLMREIGAATSDYLFGPGLDEPLAMNGGGQTSYYTVDALGSVIGVTNAAGSAQSTNLFDAWGENRATTGSLTQPFVYTSREVGEALSLFYRARHYQPSVGRFLQEDPLRTEAAEMSRYAYSRNEPVAYVDPLGLTVENASGGFVLVKPEHGPIGILPPGWCYPGRVDGVSHDGMGWQKARGTDNTADNEVFVGPSGKFHCLAGTCVWPLCWSYRPIPPDDTWHPPYGPLPIIPGAKPCR